MPLARINANECRSVFMSPTLISLFEGKAQHLPKNSFLLNIEFSHLKINSLEDLSQLIENLRNRAVPNLTYAHKHPEKASVTIAKVGNLKHAYVAIFNNSTYMNWALGRIAMFQTQRHIISGNALTRSNAQAQSFGGHDIPYDLAEAFKKGFIQSAPRDNPQSSKIQVELDFWSQIMLPILKEDPKATIIAGALDIHLGKVISHEILHANFYEKPEIKEKVDKFWREEVSDADKEQYINILKREQYDINNYEQVINEFLAYTLEYGEGLVFPEKLIRKYRDRLSAFLQITSTETLDTRN